MYSETENGFHIGDKTYMSRGPHKVMSKLSTKLIRVSLDAERVTTRCGRNLLRSLSSLCGVEQRSLILE